MDIRPALAGNYVLLRHFSVILGSVTVYVDSAGQLVLTFGDRHLDPLTHVFASGLTVAAQQWQRVSLGFDHTRMTFAVDDRTASRPVEPPLLALYAKPMIFGGHVKAEFGLPAGAQYFRGHLAGLTVAHTPTA